MTTTYTAKLDVNVTAWQVINDGIKAGTIPARFSVVADLASGTSDGQINLVYAVTETAKAASSTTSYDLTALTYQGETINFAEVVLIALYNKRTTALAYLTVKPSAAAPFGLLAGSKGFWPADVAGDNDQGDVVGPEGWFIKYDKVGVPAANGSTDGLQVVASAVAGDTNTWDLLILGRAS